MAGSSKCLLCCKDNGGQEGGEGKAKKAPCPAPPILAASGCLPSPLPPVVSTLLTPSNKCRVPPCLPIAVRHR
jgi:hypothetical protein